MTSSRSAPRHSGSQRATGSSRRSRPASTAPIAAVAVTTTLVSEARSKTVPAVASGAAGSAVRRPAASRQIGPAAEPTSIATAGAAPERDGVAEDRGGFGETVGWWIRTHNSTLRLAALAQGRQLTTDR